MVFLNGQILGVHRRPMSLVESIRKLRRAGRLGEFVSIHVQQECVYIASDGGRVCRPLIICDAGKPRVTSEHTAKVQSIPSCRVAPHPPSCENAPLVHAQYLAKLLGGATYCLPIVKLGSVTHEA